METPCLPPYRATSKSCTSSDSRARTSDLHRVQCWLVGTGGSRGFNHCLKYHTSVFNMLYHIYFKSLLLPFQAIPSCNICGYGCDLHSITLQKMTKLWKNKCRHDLPYDGLLIKSRFLDFQSGFLHNITITGNQWLPERQENTQKNVENYGVIWNMVSSNLKHTWH